MNMNDAEQNSDVTEVEEVKAVESPEFDYKALYEKAQEDIAKIAAKKDELLNETKKAKADREAAEKASKKAAEEKAQKDGEYEKLWQTTKKEKDELAQALVQYKQSVRGEKVQNNAMRIATELADGDNAELLSEFITRALDKMADDTGALSADVIEGVKNEFKSNQKYKALLRGSKANGGGATGSPKTVNDNTTELTFKEFQALSPAKRLEFGNLQKQGKAKLI